MNNSPPISTYKPVSPLTWKCVVVKIGWFLAIAGLTMTFSACGPEIVRVPVEVPRCDLRDIRQGSKFVTEAWAVPDSRINVGEPLSLQMRVSSPSYLNVFYVSTSCKVTRLLHNESVQEGVIMDFPRRGSGIEMVVKPPAGDETFYFVATRQKLEFLSSKDILRQLGGGIASLDMSPEQFYKRLEQARERINPDEWSISTLRTSVISH